MSQAFGDARAGYRRGKCGASGRATRSHRVVVVEALPPFGVIEQRLMRDRRATADVADIDRARLIKRRGRETRHVNGERQVGARSTGDARYVLNAVIGPNEDVVEI